MEWVIVVYITGEAKGPVQCCSILIMTVMISVVLLLAVCVT
jgi:hypothetical protein